MNKQPLLLWTVILVCMALIGYCFANAFYSKSFIAVMLAIISLGAGIYCVHIIFRMRAESRQETM